MIPRLPLHLMFVCVYVCVCVCVCVAFMFEYVDTSLSVGTFGWLFFSLIVYLHIW